MATDAEFLREKGHCGGRGVGAASRPLEDLTQRLLLLLLLLELPRLKFGDHAATTLGWGSQSKSTSGKKAR